MDNRDYHVIYVTADPAFRSSVDERQVAASYVVGTQVRPRLRSVPTVTSRDTRNFLCGWSVNGALGLWIGGGTSWSPGNGVASGAGWYTPQGGVSLTYGGKLFNVLRLLGSPAC